MLGESNERLSFDRSFKHGTGNRISLMSLKEFNNRQSDWTNSKRRLDPTCSLPS